MSGNYTIPFSIYTTLLIPLLNSIVYRLLEFKLTKFNFSRTYRASIQPPQYMHQTETIKAPSSGSGLIKSSDGFYHVSDHQHLRYNFPDSTLTPRLKNGFYEALRDISMCDINPDLVNATTFSAYLRLCQFLHIKMKNPANHEQCLSCRKDYSSCKCYNFKFKYLQWIKCDCLLARYGMCQCELFPELFLDLDILREYQEQIIHQFIEIHLVCLQDSDQDITCQEGYTMEMNIIVIIQSSAGLRCHIYRCFGIRMSEFLPP